MAYTLKTSGLALNAVMCTAVGEDGTIKEFVSSDVDTNKTLGTGVAASVTNGSWKGANRNYWSSTGNGSSDYHGVRFTDTHRPAVSMTNANGWSLFEAYHAHDNTGGGTVVGLLTFSSTADSGTAGLVKFTSGKLALYYSSGYRGAGTTTLPTDSTTKFSVAASYKEGASPSTRFHYGLESGSLETDGTEAISGWASGVGYVMGIGGIGIGRQPASRYVSLLFNKELSLAELQSLHDDWFGVMFDVTGGPQALAGSAAAQATASAVLSVTGAGVLTTPPLKNNAGTLLANEVGATVHVYSLAGGLVVTKAAQTSNAAGVMTITDAAIVPATQYRIVVVLASGAEGLAKLGAT